MKFPKRHNNHSLEDESSAYFLNCIPNDWNVNSVDKDYGQDLNLEISEEGQYKGLELIIQLKSSAESNQKDNVEKQTLKVATYNYLWENLRVVMIVKYVQSEKEAYWILLKDVPEPNQENETLTINIPRENLLSNIDWGSIRDYVRGITDTKLGSVRKRN